MHSIQTLGCFAWMQYIIATH